MGLVSEISRLFEAQTSELVGLNNGGGAVHGPLWIPYLHSAKVAEFLDDATTKESQVAVLAAHMGEVPQSLPTLVLEEGLPPYGTPFVYLVRLVGESYIDEHFCLNSCLEADNITGALLRLLKGFASGDETHSTRDLQSIHGAMPGHLQQLKIAITEAISDMEGHTLLCIPPFDTTNASSALKDKALLRRLETALLHWTSQVKTVLHQSSSDEVNSSEGPLAEYQFWKRRADNLQNLTFQMDSKGIHQILALLRKTQSCHLHGFLGLSKLLKAEADIAAKNAQALSTLATSCTALSTSTIQDLYKALPLISSRLSAIRDLCPYYSDIEPFTSLLRRVSNELMIACTRTPYLYNLMLEEPRSCGKQIQASIKAISGWEAYYDRALTLREALNPAKAWQSNKVAVFSQIDVFMRRCRELLELCAASEQYAKQEQLSRISRMSNEGSLASTWKTFARILQDVTKGSHSMIDPSLEAWQAECSKLQSKLQDLETHFSTFLRSAIDHLGSLYAKTYLIQTASEFACTTPSNFCISQHAVKLHEAFEDNMTKSRLAFEGIQGVSRQVPYGHTSIANDAGGIGLTLVHLMRASSFDLTLATGIDSTTDAMDLAGHGLAKSFEQVTALQSTFSAYMSSLHTHWSNNAPRDFTTLMSCPLLLKDNHKGTTSSRSLASNAQTLLHNILGEAFVWDHLKLSLSDSMIEVYMQRPRIFRIELKASTTARYYNRTMKDLSKEDRRLLQGRLRTLDRKVLAATTKLNLASAKSTVDAYYLEAVSYIVLDPRALDITTCRSLQTTHRTKIEEDLYEHHRTIAKTVDEIKDLLAIDEADDKKEWSQFLGKVIGKMMDALRLATQRTLLMLSKLIGVHSPGGNSIAFQGFITLANNARIELRPGVQEIMDTLREDAEGCLDIAHQAHHAWKIGAHATITWSKEDENTTNEQLDPTNEIFPTKDTEPSYNLSFLDNANIAMLDKMEAFLLSWETKYHGLWDQDKDVFIKRYEKAEKVAEDFEMVVERYKKIKEAVLSEPNLEQVGIVHVETRHIKKILVEHCQDWITKLIALMAKMVRSALDGLTNAISPQSSLLGTISVEKDTSTALGPSGAHGIEHDHTKGYCKSLLALHKTYIALGGASLERQHMQVLEMIAQSLANQ